jgi:hypothetical protein
LVPNLLTLTQDFSLEFDLNFGNLDGNGADGMAFVLQPVNTGQGSNGGGIGYQGIAPSVDVEFDTWQNSNNADPAADHIGINSNGNTSHSTGALVPPVTLANIEDGQSHHVRLAWNATTTTLEVWFDNTLRTSLTQDIATTIFGGNSNVYWGWTGSTGGSVNDQRVCMGNLAFSEALLVANSGSTDEVCPGACDGAVNIAVQGGVPPYAYNWSNGATTQNVGNLCAGTYCVTVTDQCGQAVVLCDTVAAGVDVIRPVIVCPANVVVNANPTDCSAAATYSATASDNCQLASVTYNPASGSIFNLGTTTVTATATDNSGNTSTCTFDVTVLDVTPPSAACQNVTVHLNNSGNATVTAAQIDNGSADNCGSVNLSLSTSAFTCANLGVNTVTLTVTDNSGNTSSCSATVHVQDLTAPVAVCQSLVLNLTNGSATISANQVNGGSTDNCSIANMSVTPSTFGCANVGNNTVVLTVTDGSGNTATCTAVVTVNSAPIVVTLSSPLNGCGYNVTACCATNGSGSGSGDGHGSGSGSGGDHGSGSGRGHGTSQGGGWNNCNDRHCTNFGRSNHGCGHGNLGHGNGHFGTSRGHGTGHGNIGSGRGHGTGHGHLGSCRGHGTGHGSFPCGHDGCVTATVIGGCAPFTYLWSNGATTASQCGLTAGLYQVTVTDGSGHTVVQSIVLTQAPNLAATATATPVSCNGAHNGTATAQPAGGCAPYHYHWNTGATSQTIGGLNPGTYTVTVTSAGGCTATASVTVTQPSRLVVDAGANQVAYPAYQPQACATLTGSVSGGTPAYSRLWTTRSGQVLGNANTVTVCPTVNTVYFFRVTDANGCTGVDSVLVCARNVSCGQNRIAICHRPPGSNVCSQNQCVAVNLVAGHLQHGDYLGACNSNYSCQFPRGRGNGSGHNDKAQEQPATSGDQGFDLALRAFPNPTNGDLTLELACMGCTEDATYQVSVTDLVGQIVLKAELPMISGEGSLRLDLSRFSSGTYLVVVENGLTKHVERIVKQ